MHGESFTKTQWLHPHTHMNHRVGKDVSCKWTERVKWHMLQSQWPQSRVSAEVTDMPDSSAHESAKYVFFFTQTQITLVKFASLHNN